jgi:hypothetical protein
MGLDNFSKFCFYKITKLQIYYIFSEYTNKPIKRDYDTTSYWKTIESFTEEEVLEYTEIGRTSPFDFRKPDL